MEKSLLVIATFLIAIVTGQSQDAPLKWSKDGILTSKWARSDYGSRKLLGHPLERSLIYGNSLQVPSYLRNDTFAVNVIPFKDVIVQPLFFEYMQLPIFRQYWNYPPFQCYVSSEYFQRFWLLPSFQQYFVSPSLFYKYIYPLVIMMKNDTETTAYEHRNDSKSQEKAQNTLPEVVTNDVHLAPENDTKEETVDKLVNPITIEDMNSTTEEPKLVEEPMVSVANMDENTTGTTAVPIPTRPTILPKNLYKTRGYAPYQYGRFAYSHPFFARLLQGNRFGGNYLNQF